MEYIRVGKIYVNLSSVSHFDFTPDYQDDPNDPKFKAMMAGEFVEPNKIKRVPISRVRIRVPGCDEVVTSNDQDLIRVLREWLETKTVFGT